MCDWQRREALALTEAIDDFCKANALRLDDGHPLAELRTAASTAAKSHRTDDKTIKSLKLRAIEARIQI